MKESYWNLVYLLSGCLWLMISKSTDDKLLGGLALCCGVYWVCKALVELKER